MPRPVPTTVAHFTHLDNVARIAVEGLRCDSESSGLLVTEVGEPSIKAQRRERLVKVEPGGVVADYVPFYFAARSPMLYSIHAGGVPSFSGDSHDVVYLMTTVEALQGAGLRLIFTDRNAVLERARHSAEVSDLDELVDWDLMTATSWASTDSDPGRKQRRMAECLVHRHVPWSVFTRLAVFDSVREARLRKVLENAGVEAPSISVTPGYYF